MRYFPVFLDLAERFVVIAGDTTGAAAKYRLLKKSDAHIRRICVNGESFDPKQLDGAALVYIATGNKALNRLISDAGRSRGILVNVVDETENCDFITPALVDRAPLTIAISSDAQAPALSRHVKARLDALLPQSLGQLGQLAESFRDTVKRVFKSPNARRRFYDRLFDGPLNELPRPGDVIRLINEGEGKEQGRVAIVGAGPGDPDLLTLKAHRALQQADVIVHDKLVSQAILDFARRDAELIYVGKSRGYHSVPQDGINDLLVELACQGKYVVRLKGGDPFIFGRGGEEVDALKAHDVAVDVMPGITAAAGCAAQAHIPLTHRDYASAVTFVAGQRKGLEEQNWAGLVGPGRTLVIYMGLGNAAAISEKLIAEGTSSQFPAAIIENGSRPEARRVNATVGSLAQAIEDNQIISPSLLIIGDVAALNSDRLARHELLPLAQAI
ncbi:MAG: siroheme synthase CysG [Sphingomonadales bacterium]|jgi:uroporphyrin-III C-methyltransferase/precorrin-2 dehydrogenase/sirohydrochlorin ferrochelatase